MAHRAVKGATPRRGNCGGAVTRIGRSRQDNRIIARDWEWERGTRWAAIALIAMFAFLSFGAVTFGW